MWVCERWFWFSKLLFEFSDWKYSHVFVYAVTHVSIVAHVRSDFLFIFLWSFFGLESFCRWKFAFTFICCCWCSILFCLFCSLLASLLYFKQFEFSRFITGWVDLHVVIDMHDCKVILIKFLFLLLLLLFDFH